MTTLDATFHSEQLQRKINYFAYIPDATEEGENTSLKTLYLLHGWSGNYLDWVHNSRIIEWAETFNIAVIMPSGENGFYTDHPHHNNFGQFISDELVKETRRLFPLSHKREETFIGGLSMGGYGAIRNGFAYSDTFSKVVALSSRVMSRKDDQIHDLKEDNPINRSIWPLVPNKTYKDLPEEMDLYQVIEKSENKPDFYLACGTDDFLLEENRALHNWLMEKEIDHDYSESSGDHNWDFWNKSILDTFTWLTD